MATARLKTTESLVIPDSCMFHYKYRRAYLEYATALVVAFVVLARLVHAQGDAIKEDDCHGESFEPSEERK